MSDHDDPPFESSGPFGTETVESIQKSKVRGFVPIITQINDRYIFTFPEINGAFASGNTLEEAYKNAIVVVSEYRLL